MFLIISVLEDHVTESDISLTIIRSILMGQVTESDLSLYILMDYLPALMKHVTVIMFPNLLYPDGSCDRIYHYSAEQKQ